MVSFVHELDFSDEDYIIEHFQSIPDITEYILASDLYPLATLSEVVKTLVKALENGQLNNVQRDEYHRTITKIESVVSTRIDYVSSIIDSLLGRESFEVHEFSLDESATSEILFHIDLIKDVSLSPEINPDDYKNALRKFIKTLKFRFNNGLEIHKTLYTLTFEEIAERFEDFPKELLEEYKRFLEDSLAMTQSHIPVKPIQIHHLKETLFKILESMGVRILQSKSLHLRAEYSALLKEIETLLTGLELDFGQKIVDRFSDLLPKYIAENWNLPVIKHNRKLVELLIDHMEDASLLSDLYMILINLASAESIQHQKKQELARITLRDVEKLDYVVKDEENARLIQMKKFGSLEIAEQARELIKLSVYGLCEYISKFEVEELGKYPIGIIKSTEKMLKDLKQHRLRESDLQSLQNFTDYKRAVGIVNETVFTYDSTAKKYNFVDIYKETDCTVDGITYCAFNDIILRLIQNIMEAYFVVDSDQKVSDARVHELQVTITERYKTEWSRQNQLRQESDQQAMEELAAQFA
ncbi:hypothetical protein CSA56_09345 [candidate division KSB3 bacterium]|uniref:Uncharacterized protein n=1 Tax=candidate division KSB3 bacterium TaxID=2044937 RepID=A0A2G6KDX5_9BACT|nr:MAG: hypothetical protein CSA56_09345 [candidate division KSB3 bacterium]